MADRIFDVRVYKSWDGRNIKAAWVNNYQAVFDGGIESPDLESLVTRIVGAEKQIHLEKVQFLHAVVSTKQDEAVYDPATLKTFELIGQGNIGILAQNPLDLNISLRLKKQVVYGRSGGQYYRGCLTDGDVTINERGETVIHTESPILNPVIWANFNSMILPANAVAKLCMASKVFDTGDPEQETAPVRIINGFAIQGVVLLKRDHRYFDRKNPVAPV